jgi:hypothetical protein
VTITLVALALAAQLLTFHDVASPDGDVVADVSEAHADGVTLEVLWKGQSVAVAEVSVRVADRPTFGRQEFGDPVRSTVDSTYPIPVGKCSVAHDQHVALTVPVGSRENRRRSCVTS